MAVSLNDIKTKIASTKNTSQITNAMQMVSAAKLGRSEEAARNFQVYAQKVRKLLTDILHGNGSGGSTNPMLISRPVKKTGYIVITSDRGLVGGYNSSILKAVMELKEEYHPDGTGFEMICIGGMAVSLNDIKTKIASTKNTSQITNAMQMVSAAKLGRSEEAARNFQVYAQKVRKLLTDILHGNGSGGSTNPMLISRPVKKTGYIVITSDRGLVGGYNSSILKAVMELKEEYHPDGTGFEMICIGGMGADFFKARGIQPLYELRGLADQPSFDQVRKIISKTVEMYQNELFDELYVCYNHHVNTLTSQMRVEQMLPIVDLDPNEADEDYSLTFELETGREEILEQLLPQFAESMIYGAIIDAKTAENAAGMTAMQTATDNAKKVINDLTIQYNRARQAAITQEITEIVAGASALE